MSSVPVNVVVFIIIVVYKIMSSVPVYFDVFLIIVVYKIKSSVPVYFVIFLIIVVYKIMSSVPVRVCFYPDSAPCYNNKGIFPDILGNSRPINCYILS